MSIDDKVAGLAAWPALIPLTVSVNPTPIPVDAFPPWVREMVEAVAASTGFDRDMAAAFALGVLSACVQGRLAVRAHDAWIEQACLYLAVVADPSEGKSPVYKPIVAPLHELNDELAKDASQRVGVKKAEREACEKRKRTATDALAKAADDERQAHLATLAECQRELDLPPPAVPLLIVDDVTPETLGGLLEAQGERLAILTSEDHLLAHLSGRYSQKSPPIEIFLKSYTGEPMRVDRRDRVVCLRQPCLTICTAMQPSVLTGKGAELADERGLLARFLFVRPPRKTGYRDLANDPPEIPAEVAARWLANVRMLALAFRAKPTRAVVGLGEEAREIWKGWRVRLEKKRQIDGDLSAVLTWAGKADGAALRIAGILWAAGFSGTGHVTGHAMEGACRLVDAFSDHAMATLGLSCADLATRSAHAVLGWLDRRGLRTFTERDAGRAGLAKGLDVKRGISELVRRGYLRAMASSPSPRGGRPSTKWEVRAGVLSGSDGWGGGVGEA